ncbi:MAG: SOS response-associated peptidase family protein [Solobacterium sp.]|nr:SOS response-associated peptidase family protein [Solobacterium sp.]
MRKGAAMCVSYVVYDGIFDAGDFGISEVYEAYFERTVHPKRDDMQVYPGHAAPVIARSRGGKPYVYSMKFGFGGKKGSRDSLNARVETAAVKPTFAESWNTRRCIVPASSYTEWETLTDEETGKPQKQKWAIFHSREEALWMCGLYCIRDGIGRFVILTQDAAEELSFIHDRMPVILPHQEILNWIDPAADPEETLKYRLMDHFCCEPD